MRRKGLWLSVLATALIAGNASAATIVGNGNTLGWGLNWGTYTSSTGMVVNSVVDNFGDEWLHDSIVLSDSDYRHVSGVRDGDPAPGTPGSPGNNDSDVTYPASGGQNYDAEELFYYYEDTVGVGGYLHAALITGFNPNGEASGVSAYPTFRAGDLFIDAGNDGTNDFAIAMAINEAGRTGNAWANSGSSWPEYSVYYDDDPTSEPTHVVADPFRINEGTPFVPGDLFYNESAPDAAFNGSNVSSNLDIAWTQLDSNGNQNHQRWLYEIRLFILDDSSILDDQNGGIGLHWTMECGNDFVTASDDTPFAPVPVPAAAPLGLLGMGLLALVRRVRRRPEC